LLFTSFPGDAAAFAAIDAATAPIPSRPRRPRLPPPASMMSPAEAGRRGFFPRSITPTHPRPTSFGSPSPPRSPPRRFPTTEKSTIVSPLRVLSAVAANGSCVGGALESARSAAAFAAWFFIASPPASAPSRAACVGDFAIGQSNVLCTGQTYVEREARVKSDDGRESP
jgi:hypothetical protein